jgi:multiple sugar transport system permease protein
LLAPAGVFIIAFVIYPLVLLVYQSFYQMSLLAPEKRVFVGFGNYVKALGSARVGGSAIRTVIYTLVALGCEFFVGFLVALVFNRLGKSSEFLRTVFGFPLMIPPIVGGLLWRFMLIDNFGIVNWALAGVGIISNTSQISWLGDPKIVLYAVAFPNIWLSTSFVALVLYTGLQNIPIELLEATRVDGASSAQMFWHVTLPLLSPVVAVVLIIRGLDAARTFDMIWIMTEGGPNFASEILSLNIYTTMMRYTRVGDASSVAVLFMIALLAFSMTMFLSIWRPERHR